MYQVYVHSYFGSWQLVAYAGTQEEAVKKMDDYDRPTKVVYYGRTVATNMEA